MPLCSIQNIDVVGGGGGSIMFNRLIPKPLQLIFRNSLVSINPQCLTSIDIVSNQISGHLKTSPIVTHAEL